MKTEPSKTRRRIVTAAIALRALTGSGAIANAVTNPSTPSTPAPVANAPTATPTPPATGVDTSNNDAPHESGESADHEANETAGRGGHSNTDAAHEASESPERVAHEAARDARLGTDATSTTAK